MTHMTGNEIAALELTPEQMDAIVAHRLTSIRENPEYNGHLPYPIFRAVGLVTVRFTVEVAFVKPSKGDHNADVLLTQRPPTDEDIPSQWHIPGATVYPDPVDPIKHYYDNDAAIDRVREEVGGTLRIVGSPHDIGTVRRKGAGRSEVTTQYMARSKGRQEEGEFFNIDDVLRHPPDEGLVDTHADTLKRVSHAYKLLYC